MKKLILLGILSVVTLVSCDRESELRIIDTSPNAKALLSFASTNYDFPVEIGTTNQMLTVEVNVSSVANVDRTFNVVVEGSSDADPQNYNVPATVTIPANAYNGTLMVTGNDVTLETTSETATITLVSMDSNLTAGPSSNIRLFQVCPIPADYFVGNYSVTDTAAIFNGANFASTSTAVTVGATSTQRTFMTTYLGTPQRVTLNLVCDELIFASTIAPGFTCGGGAITVLPSLNNTSTYSVAGGDNIFFLDYHVTATCLGPNGRAAAFAMIKI